jgi:hypothetical protein
MAFAAFDRTVVPACSAAIALLIVEMVARAPAVPPASFGPPRADRKLLHHHGGITSPRVIMQKFSMNGDL